MAKQDGQIVISTLIDTTGVYSDIVDLQKKFEELSEKTKELSKKINKAFADVDASKVSKEVKEEIDKVKPEDVTKPIQEGLENVDAAPVAEEIKEEIDKVKPEDVAEPIQEGLESVDAAPVAEEISDSVQDVNTEGLDEKISNPIKEGFDKAKESSEESTEKIKEDLDGVGRGSEESGKKIGDEFSAAFSKLAKAAAPVIALVQGTKAMAEFCKQSIELASDLEEVQNVVDVTFTTMSKQVNKFAKDADKSAGISETMAKRYVGTFGAMASSFGYAEEEAYEMSTTLTQLAGDVASFYNLSQDEAMNKLKGVFTGESEALKELGVVMTQTALDAYALENGFGKTTSAMTEQEKVSLRYSFVLDQLSAASGDFVRTQDSWSNQIKVLNLQYENLMATIGGGQINILSPALEFINNSIMPALQSLADAFAAMFEPTASDELSKSMDTLTSKMEGVEKQYEDTSKEIDRNAIKASYYVDRLKELEKAGLDTSESQKEYADTVELLNELYPELNLKISEQTGLLDDNSRAMLDNVDAMKEKYLREAKEKRYSDALEAQAEAILDIEEAEKALYAVRAEMVPMQKELEDTMSDLGVATTEYGEIIGSIPPEVENLQSELNTLRAEEYALIEGIANGKAKIAEYDVQLQEWETTTGANMAATNEFSKTIQSTIQSMGSMVQKTVEVQAATDKTTETVQALRDEYDAARKSARDSIDSQIGYFDELQEASGKSAEEIVNNWRAQQEAFDSYADNLQKAIDLGLDESLVRQLSDGSTESMAILDEFVNGTDMSVNDINEAFRGVSKSRDTVSAVMADISTDMSDKLSDMKYLVDKGWGEMADIVGSEIDRMQRYINTLTGMTVYIDVSTRQKPAYQSVSTGSGSGSISPYSISAASVPYLAKGAVIPPNAPFMAVLGDQRRGTNVEAPLSTIQEAVSTVLDWKMSGMTEGFEAIVNAIYELNDTVGDIEVGDTTVGQAVERYNRHMSIVRGTMQ